MGKTIREISSSAPFHSARGSVEKPRYVKMMATFNVRFRNIESYPLFYANGHLSASVPCWLSSATKNCGQIAWGLVVLIRNVNGGGAYTQANAFAKDEHKDIRVPM